MTVVSNKRVSPHDLLPIPNPKVDPNSNDRTWFYENVIKHLIPDIIKMEANGIPICLDKVAELEEIVTNVIQKVHEKLKNNSSMLQFLQHIAENTKVSKTKVLEAKKRHWKDYLKPFDINNTTHRSYVINTYLIAQNKKDMCMDKWSIKDLKKLNSILASNFLQALLSKKVHSSMSSYIDASMQLIAKEKAEIFNKNKIDTKIEAVQQTDLIKSFNPASAPQKQEFFKFFNI
ncbi:MAG: hypothetical protein FWC41_11370, partial [Firmicutes bacterium]|nr:hypothetical protein [Bacillota bacterium]